MKPNRLPIMDLEARVGLEPTKAGFADQRLDRFGIAASEKLYPESIPKLPLYRRFILFKSP